jgi:uncharacterized protein (DUF924 family)
MFRGMARAFEGDPLALKLAEDAVKSGDDQKIPIARRSFVYMPFMHSESKEAHQRALKLFSQKGLEENFKFEILHKRIIDHFGRFPHRNADLGRSSSPEELEFLRGKKSSF